MMPVKNYYVEKLKPTDHVELRESGGNSYWVAIIDGEEGVVNMTGHLQWKQQKMLNQMVHDTKMRGKGYKYRLTPQDGSFETLYAKHLHDCGPLMRTYPKHKFYTEKIG